jgi:hypothetical protein
MSQLRLIEAEFLKKGWKKSGVTFFRQLDEDTLSHVNVFDKSEKIVRAQMQTTNKRLNRASWAIHSLPPDFGTIKDHLTNACKCALTVSFAAREHEVESLDTEQLGTEIIQECSSISDRFRSIDQIIEQIAVRANIEPNVDRSIELICCHLANGNHERVLQLVENKKASSFPGFEMSFYGRVERYLQSHSV